MAKENKKYKDTVFTDLFYSDRDADKNLLSLYNALYGTAYTDTSVIEKVRLEDILFKNLKNDIAVTVEQKKLLLSEHQSTINPNMPVRLLLYLAREYEKILDGRAKYTSTLVKIPTPEFVVFYIGTDPYPTKELRLSDAFIVPQEELSLELKVRVENINQSSGNVLLKKCQVLDEYSKFVETVRGYKKQKDSNAIEHAVKDCIANGILSDYLSRKSEEVVNMFFAEYNYNDDIKVNREDAAEDAAALALVKHVDSVAKNGKMSTEDACKLLGCTKAQYDEAMVLVAALA